MHRRRGLNPPRLFGLEIVVNGVVITTTRGGAKGVLTSLNLSLGTTDMSSNVVYLVTCPLQTRWGKYRGRVSPEERSAYIQEILHKKCPPWFLRPRP